MAPTLGELSPKVTERALHPCFPSPSSLRSATSPRGRGKGFPRLRAQGTDRGVRPYGGAQGVLADNADNIGNQHKSP